MSPETMRTYGQEVRQGREFLSIGSLALLVRLAASDQRRRVSWKELSSFRSTYDVTESDLLPLVSKGWVSRLPSRDTSGHSLSITEEGQTLVRRLVEWLRMEAGKEVGA